MTKQDISRLNSFMGQLLDLKAGFLDALVINKGYDADVLAEIITEVIADQKALANAEKDEAKVDQLA